VRGVNLMRVRDLKEHMKLPLNLCTASSLVFSAIACADTAPPPDPTTLSQLEEKLEADCSAGRFSGVVMARQDGRIVFKHICGLADAATKAPFTEETRVKIFSVSKTFTGTLIMSLADRGGIVLDGPARRYIPEMPAEWQQITIRQLLNHTSGVPDLTDKLLAAYQAHPQTGWDGALREVLAHLTAQDKAINGTPGAAWVYNNFGYELLARAIENVTHHSYEDEITKIIFAPAGMKTAEVAKPKIENGKIVGSKPSVGLAQGYIGKPGALEPANSFQFVQMGAGAIYANAQDMFNYDSALSSGKIVSAKVLDDCVQNAFVTLPNKASYGCGWVVRQLGSETYFQHDGGNNGFVTDFARDPRKGVTVVVMSNLGFVDPGDYRYPLMKILLGSSSHL
jgi:D-alanyl-D-alanine carboxypeptidase